MNLFSSRGVDQHPIWLNVSIPVSCPVEFERVIPILREQGFRRKQKLDQFFQLLEVFASLLKPLDVALKLA
jgi:hypothetical protein